MGYNNSWIRLNTGMSPECFAAVNVPLSAVGILLNMFFVFCMVFPPQGAEQLKPLLKVLLGSLVGSNTVIHVCSCFIVVYKYVLWEVLDSDTTLAMSDVILNIMMYTMMTSVTCCHWMNMFYFCQIVPPQHPVFIWFKRNIRALIYSGLILNVIFYVFGMSVVVVFSITKLKFLNTKNSSDFSDKLLYSVDVSHQITLGNFWTRLSCFFLSVCVMLASSSATVLYLWRHVKNLEESDISSPRLQRQIKMIITGITVQALLHFLCSDEMLIHEIMAECSRVHFDDDLFLCTVISFYSFGTAINMSISQSFLRQGVVHVWHKLCQTLSFLFLCINKLL